nr:MAG TPA: hypothetical protein [Caudoviricetes sp.]
MIYYLLKYINSNEIDKALYLTYQVLLITLINVFNLDISN